MLELSVAVIALNNCCILYIEQHCFYNENTFSQILENIFCKSCNFIKITGPGIFVFLTADEKQI